MDEPTAQLPKKLALIVDPDADTRQSLRESLTSLDFELVEATGIGEAIDRAERRIPDVVLSELVLSDGSGFSLCRQLRETTELGQVPFILVSRWAQETDRILGFECGADDFVTKPFFARELTSRIRAVLRRSTNTKDPSWNQIQTDFDGLVIDSERRSVWLDGEPLRLTPLELSIVIALSMSQGRVVKRSELIAQAWMPGQNPTERNVDAHIKSLRRKLGRARYAVKTVRGLGYMFVSDRH